MPALTADLLGDAFDKKLDKTLLLREAHRLARSGSMTDASRLLEEAIAHDWVSTLKLDVSHQIARRLAA